MHLTHFSHFPSYILLPIAISYALYPVPALADSTGLRYLTVIAENDIYVPRGQDRHYTNGIRLGLGLNDKAGERWYPGLGALMPFDGAAAAKRYEIALGQNIYTPEYYVADYPIPEDRPYAGWLYAEMSVSAHAPGIEDTLAVNIGIVGPAALAEPVQKFIHTITNDVEPAGWDNQLGNEPTLLIRYRRSWFIPVMRSQVLQTDIVPRAGISLGNVFTDAGFGAAMRFGNHLPEKDLPARIQPGLSSGSSHIEIRPQHTDWMLFVEAQGRAVIRNIFLDGNTFRDSMSVDKRRLVGDAAVGASLGFGQFRYPLFLSFSFIWRSHEFENQQGSNSFGSALLGIQY